MNRHERDRYDYGRYDGYNNDEHYHGARNLTDEFEQHYRGGSGSDRYRPERSYHEGSDIEDTYNRQRSTSRNFGNRSGYVRQDRDTDTNYFGHYNDNQDNYRGDEDFYREHRDNYRQSGGRGMSSSFSDDYGSVNSGRYTGSRDQDYTYNSRNLPRNIHYIPDSDEGSDYRSGSNYAGGYNRDQDSRYDRDQDRYRSNRWNNSDDRNRYY